MSVALLEDLASHLFIIGKGGSITHLLVDTIALAGLQYSADPTHYERAVLPTSRRAFKLFKAIAEKIFNKI